MAQLYDRLRRIRDEQRRTAASQQSKPAPPPVRDTIVDAAALQAAGWSNPAPGLWQRSDLRPLGPNALRLVRGATLDLHPAAGGPCRPIALDTETSGLSTGAGNPAFLVGIGTVTDDSSCVEQLLMTDFGAEPDLIAALLDRIAELSQQDAAPPTFLSYNGAAFDLPLLRSRCIINRSLWPERAHLDLLTPVRRLYASRIGSCSLQAVEQNVLGHRRAVDVPSFEVPARYLAFTAGGPWAPFAPVLDHHVEDIHSLPEIAALLSLELAGEPTRSLIDPDPYGTARSLLRDRSGADHQRVDALLAVAAADRGYPEVAGRALELIAARARSRGDRAADGAARRARYDMTGSLAAGVALARYLEHHASDEAAAAQLVAQLIRHYGAREDLLHRAARLERRLSARPPAPTSDTDRDRRAPNDPS